MPEALETESILRASWDQGQSAKVSPLSSAGHVGVAAVATKLENKKPTTLKHLNIFTLEGIPQGEPRVSHLAE